MPGSVYHQLTATTPDDPAYEIRPSHFNQSHLVTISATGSEIVGAFSNANGLSFGLSAGAVTGSYTVPSVPSVTEYFSRTNTTFNGANISGSITNNTNGLQISLSVAPGGGGADGYNIIAAGTQTAATTGSVLFNNANGITFGMNNSSVVTASHNGLTTARASNDAIGLNTAFTAGPLAWTVNSSGLSLNAGSAAGTTSGFGGNLISGSMTHNTAGLNLSLNHPAWLTTAMASNAATISNIRVSAGTTSNLLSAFTMANGNGVSFGLDAGTITASHNGLTSQSNQNVTAANGGFAFQTLSFSNLNGISFGTSAGSAITASHNALTTARASNDAIGLNTAQTNVTWTVNSSGLSLNAAGYAGTGTSATNASITLNSNGLAISVGAGGGVTPVASASNGSFSFTTLAFSNANNVTFGTSAGSIITASVAAPGAAAENNAINLLGANTAGNTTATGSTIGYSGINLTLSGTNNSVVNISAPATSSLSATGLVSISTNGSTISIGVPAGTATMWMPFNEAVNAAGQQGNASMHFVPLPTPVPAALGELHIDRLCLPLIISNSSNSTGTVTVSYSLGLYTKNASTLSLAMSTSYTFAATFSGTVNNSTYAGLRLHTVPWTTTIQDGRYFVAQWSRTTTGGGNCTVSQWLASQANTNFSGLFGGNSNRSYQYPLGFGVYSVSFSTAMPNSVAFSHIDGTASVAARPPSFFMISGTA